jgi:hypothetical protein
MPGRDGQMFGRESTKWEACVFGEDCPFKVVRTNGSDEVLARAANLLIGRAAFETAKRMYPKDLIEYRRGAQVLERSRQDDKM